MERPLESILARLDVVDRKGRYHNCRCPAHEDQAPSLRVWEASDGAACVKCMSAGCSTEAILGAIGLAKRDLFPAKDKRTRENRYSNQRRGKPAVWKDGTKEIGTFLYQDEAGKTLFETVRVLHPPGEDGKPAKNRMIQRRKLSNGDVIGSLSAGWYIPKGKYWSLLDADPDNMPADSRAMWFEEVRYVLYRLIDVRDAIANKCRIWLCEGEPDVEAIRREGESATCNPMGAGKWRAEYTHELLAAREIVIVCDRDKAGYQHAMKVAEALREAGQTHLRIVQAAVGKDADDHLAAGKTLDELVEIDPAAELERLATEKAANSEQPALSVVEGGGASGPPRTPPTPPPGESNAEKWLPWTDTDNAELLLERHGEDLRWCHLFGSWMVWDGHCWVRDETGGSPVQQFWTPIAREVDKTGRQMFEPVEGESKDEAKEREGAQRAAKRFAKYSLDSKGFQSMMQLAKNMPGVPVVPGIFDQVLEVLPVRNGYIDLRTGQLRPAERSMYITRAIDIDYKADADCPLWIKFLRETVGDDDELMRYLWKASGYSLTGLTSEQKFFFLYGQGKTGKTTFLETISRIAGGFTTTIDPKHLMMKKYQDAVPEYLARLRGARIVKAVEVNENDRFDEGLVKRLTGDEVIQARYMRQDSFEFYAIFKLWLTGNARPVITDPGDSFWRRLVPISFVRQVAEEDRDLDLKAKLWGEREGILAWMVAGCVKWYEEGLGLPKSIKESHDDYRDEMDVIGQFLRDCTTVDAGGWVQSKDLYRAYVRWAKEGGATPWSHTILGRRLAVYGLAKAKTAGNSIRYLGIELKPEAEATE